MVVGPLVGTLSSGLEAAKGHHPAHMLQVCPSHPTTHTGPSQLWAKSSAWVESVWDKNMLTTSH